MVFLSGDVKRLSVGASYCFHDTPFYWLGVNHSDCHCKNFISLLRRSKHLEHIQLNFWLMTKQKGTQSRGWAPTSFPCPSTAVALHQIHESIVQLWCAGEIMMCWCRAAILMFVFLLLFSVVSVCFFKNESIFKNILYCAPSYFTRVVLKESPYTYLKPVGTFIIWLKCGRKKRKQLFFFTILCYRSTVPWSQG